MKMNRLNLSKIQIITITITIMLILVSIIFKRHSLNRVLLHFFTVIIFIIIFPKLTNSKLNRRLRDFIITSTLLLPIVKKIDFNIFYLNFKVIIIGVIVSVLIVILNYSSFMISISKKKLRFRTPMTYRQLRIETMMIIYIVLAEEIFFRFYLSSINIFYVALAFVIYHFINRNAKDFLDFASAIRLFSLSMILSILFQYTNSISLVILLHLVFNLPFIISCYNRTKIDNESVSFRDYE